MIGAVLTALLSHWRRHPVQGVTLILGLALATALWAGVQAINAEAKASYAAAAGVLGEGQFDQLVASDGGPITLDTYISLRRAGWLVSPVVEGRLGSVRLVGVDPLTAPGGIGPGDGDIGAFLGAGQIIGRADVLAALGDTGLSLVESPDAAPGVAMTDIGVALRLLDAPGLSRLIVAPDQPLGQPSLDQIAPGLMRQAAGGVDIGALTDSFHLNLTAFGLLAFAVGIFIVQGAVGLAFEQRRPMIRTLRALGVPLRMLMGLMLVELLLLALVAGAIGLALGYLVAAALLPDVAATLRGLYGADVAGTLSFRPGWALAGLAMAVGGALLAGIGALWRLLRLPLLATAHAGVTGTQAARMAIWQAGAAMGLLVIAGGLLVWGKGIAAGFGMLGCLLLAGALALPPVLSTLLALGARLARSALPHWFWADARAGLPSLSLALMALLLALSANIGVATMVSSFRLTFTAFLDQRLAAEMYVQTRDPAQAAALLDFVASRVDAVLPINERAITIAGTVAELYGARDHATYRDNWRFLDATPQVWDRLHRGAGVIINEQLARRLGLTLGDGVTVAPGRVMPVLGIYGDYGNPVGQVILTESLMTSLYPEEHPLRFGLRLPPAGVPALRDALTGAFGLPDAQIIDQGAIKALSLQVFDRTFTVTGALNVLTLAVAGFALLTSLLTLSSMRLPQMAPLWALGLPRAALGALDLARVLLLAALTVLLALPLGLALAWVLLAVVNPLAFGWRLPMYLFPWDYLRLALTALGAALLAALWPARHLARRAPADLLRAFADER